MGGLKTCIQYFPSPLQSSLATKSSHGPLKPGKKRLKKSPFHFIGCPLTLLSVWFFDLVIYGESWVREGNFIHVHVQGRKRG